MGDNRKVPTARWKAVEMWYCRKLGAERRGADYGSIDYGGKTDCADSSGYSAEIRHRKSVSFNMIREQIQKAEQRARPDQIPISIAHIPGMRLDDGVVSMSFREFSKWFVSVKEEELP